MGLLSGPSRISQVPVNAQFVYETPDVVSFSDRIGLPPRTRSYPRLPAFPDSAQRKLSARVQESISPRPAPMWC